MEASPRLRRDLLPLRVSLIVEHVRVPAFLAKILREGIARPHGLQARVLLESGLSDNRARVGLGRRARLRFAPSITRDLLVHGAAVVIVLQRKVLPPYRGVFGLF